MNQFSSVAQFLERALERGMVQALPTNIVDKDDGFELSVKVPGVARKDIVVDINGRVVKVAVNQMVQSVEGTPEQPASPKGVHLAEFAIPSKAERSFEFREALDADAAKLDLADGVLTVWVAYQTRGTKRTLTLND